MRHFDAGLAHIRIATDEQPCLVKTVDQLPRCRFAIKAGERGALTRRDAAFGIDFHQLFEDLTERLLVYLLKLCVGGFSALGNSTLDAIKTVVIAAGMVTCPFVVTRTNAMMSYS
jgi:hypothetical protein